MFRFALFVFLLIIKENVSQEPIFIKFVKNDLPITSLSEQTFSSVRSTNIKNIYVVKLQSCQIGNVDEATFRKMPYLRVVSLPFNQIKEIPWSLFANNRHIKIINFANNEIGMLQDGVFENLNLVESITFANNKIVRIESMVFKDLIMLKSLDLSNNHLKSMWPEMFMNTKSLQRLQLNGNKIDSLGTMLFSSLENLVYLDLNRNQITEIDPKAFENLKSMIMLNLEHNYIEHIKPGTFDNTTSLRALNLDENNLEALENGLFTKLMSLEHLSLKANNIRRVAEDVFPQTINLSSIALCRNRLMSLEARSFEKLHGLRTLCVADNPWYCDCNIMDFHAYYMRNENITKETIICYKPDKLGLRSWTEINSTELDCDTVHFDIEDINLLPISTVANSTIKMPEYTLYPPFVQNSLDLPTESDFENENMTMERITREEMQMAAMKVDLGGFNNPDRHHTRMNDDSSSRLPDCFNNKPTYFDERYNKNFIEWRARFLGEFLIMYSSLKHNTFYSNSDMYIRAGTPMLVPYQNGFTFMDPNLTQMDWKYINEYLQEICSVTNNVLNGDKNMVRNYPALEEANKLIDSLSEVIKEKLKENPNKMEVEDELNKHNNNNNNLRHHNQPVREVHHMMMKTDNGMATLSEMMPHFPKPNMTDGKNLFYYIINARAEGQAHVNINTGK